MKVNDAMHPVQVKILHVLLFSPSASFAELRKASDLSSDHFTFHLKQMQEQEIIAKNEAGHYTLTTTGKEYANRFDTETRSVERQPKVAVLLTIHRPDGKQLYQQRLKQPFYGYWGVPTGKIRWGETILDAARRELLEETGLEADVEFESIYHKMDYNHATGQLLEDKIFFIITCTNPRGTLIEQFEGGRNAWLTHAEYAAQELSFESADKHVNQTSAPAKIPIVESCHKYAPEVY